MATTIIKQDTLVGKRIRRKEDPRLITGTATYVDDIQMPGMNHACILRSPHAAAKIRGIHVDAARRFRAAVPSRNYEAGGGWRRRLAVRAPLQQSLRRCGCGHDRRS